MSDHLSLDPLGQFLGDLSAIREKRNVSLEALRDATKVYPSVITQFEQNGLKDHPLFNSLYVRAFIRSYAATLGISVEEVLDAYDRALQGKYNRQLAVEYLDLPPEEIETVQEIEESPEKIEPVFAADKFEFDASSDEIEAAAISGAKVTYIPKSREGDSPSPFNAFVAQSQTGLRSFFESGKQNAVLQWGVLAGGIALGLFVILQLLSMQAEPAEEINPNFPTRLSESTETEEEPAASLIAPDTAAAPAIETTMVPTPVAPVALGDSIPLYIVAESGKLDPFRLKIDRDLRRPYWLDEGDSMLFYLKDQAVVEDHLDIMKILVEGDSYPIYETDSLARVVINRDSIQAFLASR